MSYRDRPKLERPWWTEPLWLLWFLIGLPGYVLGALYKGSPIPDPPPFLQHPYEDYSLLANALYFLVIGIMLLPVLLIPGLIVKRRRNRKISNA